MAVDDSYTVLLLHGNGVDGATSFVDEAGKIVTPVGNTCIKTDQSRFGGASMFFDGSGDSLTVGTSTDFAFGIGDFTIEMWVNASAFGTNGIFFAISATGGLIFGRRDAIDSWGICAWGGSIWGVTATPLPSLNTWHHVAMVRATGILTLYLDGIAVASGTDVRYYTGGAATLGLNGFTGYIDEVRISKGIARWTENFIPSDTAYTSLTLYPDAPIGDAQVLLIGGGGGGGSGEARVYEGGGGGAGGFIETVLELSAGVYPITIGVGGPPNLAGAPSTFGSLLHAFAGGYGGGPSGAAGGPGASGGGSRATGAAGITIAPEQGNNGGGGVNPSGGGGGANSPGASGAASPNGPPGGQGKTSDISGTATPYSGGGGGAATTNGTGGLGGSSVGGNGANWGLVGNAAVPNTGSGGGGGSSKNSKSGGSGASGVCIIRYLSGSINGSGGTVTFDGDYVIHTFTSSGVFIASAVREYVSEGIAVFGPYILPTMVEEPLSSLLSWSAIVPVNTFAMVDIAIVDTVPVDTDYIPAVNGGAIPDLTMASSEKSYLYGLRCQLVMSTLLL